MFVHSAVCWICYQFFLRILEQCWKLPQTAQCLHFLKYAKNTSPALVSGMFSFLNLLNRKGCWQRPRLCHLWIVKSLHFPVLDRLLWHRRPLRHVAAVLPLCDGDFSDYHPADSWRGVGGLEHVFSICWEYSSQLTSIFFRHFWMSNWVWWSIRWEKDPAVSSALAMVHCISSCIRRGVKNILWKLSVGHLLDLLYLLKFLQLILSMLLISLCSIWWNWQKQVCSHDALGDPAWLLTNPIQICSNCLPTPIKSVLCQCYSPNSTPVLSHKNLCVSYTYIIIYIYTLYYIIMYHYYRNIYIYIQYVIPFLLDLVAHLKDHPSLPAPQNLEPLRVSHHLPMERHPSRCGGVLHLRCRAEARRWAAYNHLEVSWNRGTPKSINPYRIFPYKPSSCWGNPHWWKPPFGKKKGS